MKRMDLLIIGIILLVCLTFVLNTYQKAGVGNEIYIVTMSPANMREQFLAGNIDGFIAWEPFNADLVLNKNASYLVQSSEIWPNHPCCILSTKNEDKELIKALVWTHVKATEFINNESNKENVITYATEFTGMDEEVVKEALKHINFIEYPNEEEFKFYYHKLKESEFLKKTPEELGYGNLDEFLDDFLVRTYYDEVKNKLAENSSWKPDFINKSVRLGYLTADLHQLSYYVALKEGFYSVFKDIEFFQFKNGPAVMNAYRANLIDAAYLGGAPATLKRINEDIHIKIIAGVNEVGSAIVVKEGIHSLKDLKGRTLATPGFGTVQDFILRMAAESVGLNVTLKK